MKNERLSLNYQYLSGGNVRAATMRRLLKWLLGLLGAIVLIVATIILVRAFDARRQPPLQPWHEALTAEVRAQDLNDRSTLADYLRIEDAVFVEMERRVIAAVPAGGRTRSKRRTARRFPIALSSRAAR